MDTPSKKLIDKLLSDSEDEKKEMMGNFGRRNMGMRSSVDEKRDPCAAEFLAKHPGMILEDALPYFEKCYPIAYLVKKVERISSEMDEIKTKGLTAQEWERIDGILTAVKIDGDIYEREEKRLTVYGKHVQDELFNQNGLTPIEKRKKWFRRGK